MKKVLKNIFVSPMSPVELGKDIKIAEEKTFDISHLSEEERKKFLEIIHAFAKHKRSNGVIVTKGVGNSLDSLISIQINSSYNKKNVLSFPEPSLSRIYFQIATENFNYAIALKNELINIEIADSVTQYNTFTSYIGYLSMGCIMTISCLEAFANSIIPIDFSMEIDGIIKNKSDLEYIDFNSKITQLLPEIFKSSFHSEFPKKYQSLCNCNSLRDDFVHPKIENNKNKTCYEVFYKRAFDAKIKDFSNSAFELINYYADDYLIKQET